MRMELRAARGWSTQQTAERFHVTEETIASWMRRLDEGGEAGLVRAEEPLNKFPDCRQRRARLGSTAASRSSSVSSARPMRRGPWSSGGRTCLCGCSTRGMRPPRWTGVE
ncbi:MAG: helix-turn-helix domain-containing protein [Planctomycetes bacterium]|nr:helix-turn-helix domain-containing protein [Planctomycetota bacterium]